MRTLPPAPGRPSVTDGVDGHDPQGVQNLALELDEPWVLHFPVPRELDLNALENRGGPAAEDQHLVAQVDRLKGIVGDEPHRFPRLFPDAEQLRPERARGHLVEVAERFVHEEKVRLDGERPGDGDPLLHPARQRQWEFIRELVETHHRQVVQRLPSRLGGGGASSSQGESDVVAHAPPIQQARLLEDVADSEPARVEVRVVDEHLARVGKGEPGNDIEDRRLAASRRSHHATEFLSADGESDIAKHRQPPARLTGELLVNSAQRNLHGQNATARRQPVPRASTGLSTPYSSASMTSVNAMVQANTSTIEKIPKE